VKGEQRRTMNSYILSKVKISILLAVVVGLVTYAVVGVNTEAASKDCFKTSTAKASIKVSGGQATANFTIPKNCTPKKVTLVSYKAPNGTNGKPYPKQTVHAFNTKTFQNPGKHVIKVDLPNCFYQVDLVRGDHVIQHFSDGNTYTAQNRLITAKHGGKQSCEPKKAPAPAAKTKPAAPAPPATPAPAPVAPAVTVVNENNNVNNNENTNIVVNSPAPAAPTPAPDVPEEQPAPAPEQPAPVAQKPAEEAPSSGKDVNTLPNTGPTETLAAFSFTFTFLSSMIVSYRNRFTDILGSVVARF